MKTTPWFPGDMKPVRVGVYQRLEPFAGVALFSYWNGFIWCAMRLNQKTAELAGLQCLGSNQQRIKWRGLTEPTGKK